MAVILFKNTFLLTSMHNNFLLILCIIKICCRCSQFFLKSLIRKGVDSFKAHDRQYPVNKDGAF